MPIIHSLRDQTPPLCDCWYKCFVLHPHRGRGVKWAAAGGRQHSATTTPSEKEQVASGRGVTWGRGHLRKLDCLNPKL